MQKRAVITGATSGIGMATALRLAAQGMNLIITGRRQERLSELKDKIKSQYSVQVEALCFDIRSREQVESQDFGRFGQIDILVNNAGLAAGLEHINDGDTDDWDAMIDTNVKGVLYITRLISKLMIAQGKGGHIVNLGSIAGVQVYENGAAYCASKHAMHALSQGMRLDFLSHGIRVSEIRPGMVQTEFSDVRFHGDTQRAQGVYQGVTPLTGDDIARTIEWIVSLPSHVNINDLEIMPTAQASAFTTFRKN